MERDAATPLSFAPREAAAVDGRRSTLFTRLFDIRPLVSRGPTHRPQGYTAMIHDHDARLHDGRWAMSYEL